MEIEAAAQTDVGRIRPRNEDLVAVDDKAGVYLVADGMGGRAAGSVAARLAAHAVLERFRRQQELEGPATAIETLSAVLAEAFKAAHATVAAAAQADGNLAGMGTTLVVAARLRGTGAVVIGHLGDSRAYLLRMGRLRRLTSDDSWVHELVTAGILRERDCTHHPLRHVLTRAVGRGPLLEICTIAVGLEAGDLLLLCSDGLHHLVDDGEIRALLEDGGPLATITRRLVDAANARGGSDNIAVVLLRAVPSLGDEVAGRDEHGVTPGMLCAPQRSGA